MRPSVMAEPDAAVPQVIPSRVDRVWLALPYLLLVGCLAISWSSGELVSTDVGWAAVLGATTLAWHTWWTALHPAWLAVDRVRMGIYYLGFVALTAALFSLTFNFFPLYLTCFPMAFVALPGAWAYVGVAVATAVALLGPGMLTLSAENVVVTAAGALLAAVAGGSIRALEDESERRRAAHAELARTHAELEAALAANVRLTQRLVVEARESAVAAERTRLAADIHDNLAAGLSGILAQLQALDAELPESAPVRDRVGTSIEVARECLRDARRSVTALRSPSSGGNSTDEKEGGADLPATIRLLAQQISDRFDLPVEVRVTGVTRPLPGRVAEALLQAAREALTNAAKHARAGRAYLTLSFLEDRVAVDVADDGHGRLPVGNALNAVTGHGLAIITERLAEVGGSVEVAGEPGSGTTVTLVVPNQTTGEDSRDDR